MQTACQQLFCRFLRIARSAKIESGFRFVGRKPRNLVPHVFWKLRSRCRIKHHGYASVTAHGKCATYRSYWKFELAQDHSRGTDKRRVLVDEVRVDLAVRALNDHDAVFS